MASLQNGEDGQSNDLQPTSFGHAMRKHFAFGSDWRNLNHGSFGTYPIAVRDTKRRYMDMAEAAPDKFLRYQFDELSRNARRGVAQLLNVPEDEVVFVTNATTGVNTVLRNLTYKEKDVIVYFDTIYGAIEKTLVSIVETTPQLQIRKVGFGPGLNGFAVPMSHAEICTAFSQTISRLLYEGYNIRAAVFDTIASLPAVRYPFERLVRMCKEYGILSIIDGAHAIGHIPLDLGELQPDFFVSNCHKWLFTPRGCAVFHVPKRNQALIRTSYPTSHGYVPPANSQIRDPLDPPTESPFVHQFKFVATTDDTPYYSVPAALEFRQRVCGGEQAIYDYMRDIGQQGGDTLAKMFGTTVMDDLAPEEQGRGSTPKRRSWAGGLRDCAMATVLLPVTIADNATNGQPASSTLAGADQVTIQRQDVPKVKQWLERTMTDEHHTFVPVFEYQGQMWIRVCGQIYLEAQDFEWLGGILKSLLKRIGAGEATAASLPVKEMEAVVLDD